MTPDQVAKSGTEHSHQVALFAWAALQAKTYPELRLMFAIPNQRHTSVISGARFKAEGVKAGLPDIFLPAARGRAHGLFLELKRPGGVVAKEQYQWNNSLNDAGYIAIICYGWEEARDAILTYLKY